MNDQVNPIDEVILGEFESAWIDGQPLTIQEALARVDKKRSRATLVELVLIDIEFSWKAWSSGQPIPKLLEFYVEQFSQLQDPGILQELLAEEYRIRKQHGDQARYSEFDQRFSHIIDELEFTQSDVEDGVLDVGKIDIGSVVGKFTIVSRIGEGGMGSVFVAQQREPVERQVALKIIKTGLNSKEVVARFEAERQALALMDHPNIARILDGGTTANGQPYFAMELVEGAPMTEYCDDQKLGLNQRLNLFVDVCDAVQHAHQKGIIHRDLKPSNILVGVYDGRPVAKVIDFGLAKALNSEKLLTDQTLATQFGQVVGTFKYMSPEQADSSPDIDTRTDVYALGVILYELLTGSTPIDQKTLQGQALIKLLEIIRDHDPPRPSTKLSSLNQTASTVTERRQTDPVRLTQILRGDLDWVVMKALEKERHRRYETASSFSDDVKRFLGDEPVLARPPSTSYKLKKYLRKHRGWVASGVSITALLVFAIGATSWFAYQANLSTANEIAQRKIADQKTIEANEQKGIADEARNQAEASSKRSNEVLRIVSASFKSANPNEGAKATMPAKKVLFNARDAMVNSDLDELGKATLLDALTISFRGLGEFPAAIESADEQLKIYQRVYGQNDLRTANALNSLGNGYFHVGKHDQALPLFERVVAIRKKKLGLANEDTLGSMGNLANALEGLGQEDDALKLREEVLALCRENFGTENQITLNAINNLSGSYHRRGRIADSIKLLEEALVSSRKVNGTEHPTYLVALQNLAIQYAQSGNFEKSIERMEAAIASMNKVLGDDHPDTLAAMTQLSTIYYVANQLDKALELAEKTYELSRRKLGEKHPDVVFAMRNLANCYNRSGQLQRAIEVREKSVELSREIFGEEHPETLSAEMGLANLYDTDGKPDQALQLRERLFAQMSEKLGESHPETIKLMSGLGASYMGNGRLQEGVTIFEKAYRYRKELLGEQHRLTVRAKQSLEVAKQQLEDAKSVDDQ